MMQAVGAKSQESFDLLENVDSAGALVFSRNDEMPTIASVRETYCRRQTDA